MSWCTRPNGLSLLLTGAALMLGACADNTAVETSRGPTSSDAPKPADVSIEVEVPASVATIPTQTSAEATSTTMAVAATAATAATAPAPAPPVATAPPAPAPAPASTSVGVAIPALGSGTTSYAVPTPQAAAASWGDTHTGYPASDIFVPGENGCGGEVISPVNGVVTEARFDNLYDRTIDNPALRGGRSVTVVGDDGVRYYLAHFATLDSALQPGARVSTGQFIGIIGDSGRSSACHVHFAISPPCIAKEWSVRRGVVWPYPYLNAWRDGQQVSPVDEVTAWLAANPNACAEASADPNAIDA